MWNSIYRFLCGLCAPSSSEHGLHGAHPAVAALGRDVLSFQSTSQVSRASSIPRLRVWRCRGCGVGFAHLVPGGAVLCFFRFRTS